MNRKPAGFERITLLRAAFVALAVAPASASVHTLTCTLNGVEEVPANTSLGLGTATLSLDDVALTVTITTGSYGGLMTGATVAHIHGISGIGVSSPVLIPILVTGGTSGTLSGGGSLSAADVTNMINGLTYLNIHTSGLPLGELRGQILEPPTLSSTFCYGDGSIAAVCPCVAPNIVPSPAAGPLHGCANSFNLNGALLKVSGTTSPDTIRFLADIGKGTAAFGVMIKGTGSLPAGFGINDGIVCVAGAIIRFGSHFAGTNGAPLGMWTYPNTVQTTPVSFPTPPLPGTTLSYQLVYRNTAPSFCTALTTNYSSGMLITW